MGLRHEAARAALDRRLRKDGIARLGEHDYARLALRLTEALQCLHARGIRQAEVEQDQVRTIRPRGRDRFRKRAGRADARALERFAGKRMERLLHHRMVLDDEDLHSTAVRKVATCSCASARPAAPCSASEESFTS